MGIIQIAAFAALVIWIAYREKEILTDVIPVAVCLLVLVLYGLSFVNGLLWVDYLALGICLAAIYKIIKAHRIKEAGIGTYLIKEAQRPGNIVAILLLLLVPVFVSKKVVTWWDDYNFWATDVKSIFYLNGFASKYQNVAPEFGDYPPGTQMMKWWFLHLFSSDFKEGLMFAGYYFMNLAFLVPLLKYLKKKNVFVMILSGVALWLFPTCVEVFGCDGCCADLTMAVIYGAFLMSVIERQEHSSFFYYGRQALFLMVLVLCKNTGFIWVIFGLLFAYGYQFFQRKEQKMDKIGLFWITILPVLIEGSWLLFCLLNRRVAKLTGAALHMATGSMNVPEVQEEMVNAFFTAFVRYPLHRWSTFAIDLSPLALYLLLLLFVFLLYKTKKIIKWQAWYLGGFLLFSGICFYAINLVSHLTIFAVETQYLEPFGMVSSIERYGAPFTIGGLYLVACLVMGKKDFTDAGKSGRKNWGILLCLLFVFLTADYQSAYRALIGYRDSIADTMQEREKIVDEQAKAFLEKVKAGQSGSGKRVLYLRDTSDISWVRNTYTGFEAAPVSVMYGNLDGKTAVSKDVLRAIDDAHAGYLYADEILGGDELFDTLTAGEAFEYGCLYEVSTEGEKTVLKKVLQ